MIQDGRPVRHKKTGERYWFICHGTDSTDAREGNLVAIYQLESNRNTDTIFVRDLAEFNEKFEEIKE